MSYNVITRENTITDILKVKWSLQKQTDMAIQERKRMTKTNAIQMNYDEYAALIKKITNGEAELHNDGYDWYYVTKDCYYEEANVKEKLQAELDVVVDSVIIDLSNKENGVAIIIKKQNETKK